MKKTLTKVMVVLLPFLAAALATTGDSVRLVNMVTGETVIASYFDLLPAASLQLAPPLAGMCAVLSCILAVLYLLAKKDGLLQGARWTAFVGACFAVLPMFVDGEEKMLPNVGVPLLLMVAFLVDTLGKGMSLNAPREYQAPRLERH